MELPIQQVATINNDKEYRRKSMSKTKGGNQRSNGSRKPFKGTIKLDVRDSTPDWSAFLAEKSPEGAPNVLVILYDDTGCAAWSPYGGRGSTCRRSTGWRRMGSLTRNGTPRRSARRRARELAASAGRPVCADRAGIRTDRADSRRYVQTSKRTASKLNERAQRRDLLRPVAAAGQQGTRALSSETTNGWRYTIAGGRAGHHLALRAALANYVIGAQLSDQVIYPNCRVDEQGQPLNGANRYILLREKGKQPALSVFWNLAMYGEDMLFVENDFGRYSIGCKTDGLKENSDGSLTLYIQNERPSDTSNWLPAPAGSFNVTMWFYGPPTSVLDGSYRLSPVTRQ